MILSKNSRQQKMFENYLNSILISWCAFIDINNYNKPRRTGPGQYP